MSLATLLDQNKALAATDAVVKNPQIPWLPSQLSCVIACSHSRTEPGFLGVDLGDATVQRTVGGRVTPTVLRDVAYISYLTETKIPTGSGGSWQSSTTPTSARRCSNNRRSI
jgi:carbonic anhydrase